MAVIGLDIGGTRIKAGIVEDGSILHNLVRDTKKEDVYTQSEEIITELLSVAGSLGKDISGISIGFPGVVIDGVIKSAPNISLPNENYREMLKKKFSLPVVIKNDANLATLAEYQYYKDTARNIVMLTIGTGVGGGIIIDGKLYEGLGSAGELGHITFEYNGRLCGCGRKGCLEQYVSCSALSKMAMEYRKKFDNSILPKDPQIFATTIEEAYLSHDKCAEMIVEEYTDELSDVIVSILNTFRSDLVIIGGGLSKATKIIEVVSHKVELKGYGLSGGKATPVVPARLSNDAGVLASEVVLEK